MEPTAPIDEFAAAVVDGLRQSSATTSLTERLAACAPVVGKLLAFDVEGRPLVELPSVCPGAVLVARSTVALPRGRHADVVVLLEEGDRRRPIIVGVLQPTAWESEPNSALGWSLAADGKAMELVAARELVLRCGEASITLSANGKVLIRGRHIVSRSSGANKVKGAVVDIN